MPELEVLVMVEALFVPEPLFMPEALLIEPLPLGADMFDWLIDEPEEAPLSLDIEEPWVVLMGDAVLPGDMPGEVSVGAFGAPFGAGAGVVVCAEANPAETMKAAEANHSERISLSLYVDIRRLIVSRNVVAGPSVTRIFALPGH